MIPRFSSKTKLTLLYRLGKDDAWNLQKLQNSVYDKGATVVLVKSGVGWVAGGYTSVPWQKQDKVLRDDEAVLFSVTNYKKYPVVDKDQAVRHNLSYGVSFGYNENWWNLGFGNDTSSRYAYSSFEGCGNKGYKVYNLEKLNGKSPLTGEGTYNFNLVEAEIFLVEH